MLDVAWASRSRPDAEGAEADGGAETSADWGALSRVGGFALASRGRSAAGRRWTWAAGAVYGVFFLWAGSVLLRALLR